MLHPGNESLGYRVLEFEGDVYVPRQEIVKEGGMIRLKDLFNVEISWKGENPAGTYAGEALAEARSAKAPIIQWLPVREAVHCTLRTPEGDIEGLAEPLVKNKSGKVIQFERVGFARIDTVDESGIRAYFSHR